MYSTELGINFFGNESNKKRQLNKIEILKKNIKYSTWLKSLIKKIRMHSEELGITLFGSESDKKRQLSKIKILKIEGYKGKLNNPINFSIRP